MFLRAILPLGLVVGCATEPAGDCELATQHVNDCYGDEVAAAFAEACTAETATTALAEQCESADGKSDLFGSTPILSPAVEQFKYGSIGADQLGMPIAIAKALPIVCADLLPPGTDPWRQPLSAFGLIYEAGKELPIGFSQRKLPLVGITLVGNTCSACHTATVRATPTAQRTLYFGAPNTRFDLERYNEFLFSCIADTTRFNATTLDRAFGQLGVTGLERLLAYNSGFFRAFVGNLQKRFDSVVSDGPWGPGRDDAIGLSGAMLLGPAYQPAIPAPVDFPSVWNQQARKGHALHWDGAAGSALERNVLVAVGAGTPRDKVPLASINAIQTWLDALPSPKYPFAIDQAQVARGAQVFAERCASCHAANGTRTWSVIPLAEVGTDPNRVNAVTPAAIDAINTLSGAGWTFDNFRKTNGYATSLLDGIWLRAPYLHNGSVPTLRDLLLPPAQRPRTFYRGNDMYDQLGVGFVSTVAREGNASYMLFDTARQGNSNAGHVYGTDLGEADRNALLEYMKTL
jgi:cytochrome c5